MGGGGVLLERDFVITVKTIPHALFDFLSHAVLLTRITSQLIYEHKCHHATGIAGAHINPSL